MQIQMEFICSVKIFHWKGSCNYWSFALPYQDVWYIEVILPSPLARSRGFTKPSFQVENLFAWNDLVWKGGFSKRLRIHILCDPASPLLGIYYAKHMKALIQKDICTPMLTSPLLTMAKTWKILPSATWIGLDGIMLSEINQMEKGKKPYHFTHMLNIKPKRN